MDRGTVVVGLGDLRGGSTEEVEEVLRFELCPREGQIWGGRKEEEEGGRRTLCVSPARRTRSEIPYEEVPAEKTVPAQRAARTVNPPFVG